MSSLTSWLGSADRRLLILIAALLAVVLVGATVGGVYGYQQSRPTTVSFNLKPGQTEVPLDQKLTVSFSRPLSQAAVAAHLHLAPAVEGHLQPAPGGRSFTWISNGPLADLTAYTLTVESFKDGGHSVSGGRVGFTTTLVPRVTAVATEAGAGLADGADIPLGTKLVMAFNTAMDQPSVQVTANGAAAKLAWAEDAKSATIDTGGIPIGPLAIAIGAGRDAAGRVMPGGWKLGLNLVFRINVHTTPLRFPALVQVPNDPTARDQSGLQSADMVFEYATEGGIPRFTAMFTNVPDKVGPTRSGRLISIKLTRHYHGELYLSGTSEGTFGVLSRDPVPAFFDTAGYYYRSYDRPAPNNLYINGDAIARAEYPNVAAFKPPTGTPKLAGGADGAHPQVAAHNATYDYDGTTRTYFKSEAGHRFSDASIGQPLRITMVIVMHTTVTTTGIIEDVNGAHGLDYDTESGGHAEIYYQGQSYSGRWAAADRSSPFTFTLDNGTQVPVPPGLVWVDVVP